MSWEALGIVSKYTVGSSTDKMVLIVLANFSDEQGHCYPSHKKISQIAECSIATVIRSLKRLKNKNFIDIQPRFQTLDNENRRQTSNLYIINLDYHNDIGSGLQNDMGGGSQKEIPITNQSKPVNNEYKYRLQPRKKDQEMLNILFDNFWNAYPKRPNNNKHGAYLKYVEAIKEISPEKLLQSVHNFSRTQIDVEAKYIPHAKTWLNQKRYLDEAETSNVVPLNKTIQLKVEDVINAKPFFQDLINRDGDKQQQVREMINQNLINIKQIKWFKL